MAIQPLLFRALVLFQLGPIISRATGTFVSNMDCKHVIFYFLIVFVNRAEGVAFCKGSVAEIICTTTTRTGFLLWQNSSGKSFNFGGTATVGANGTLGTTTMTLNRIETVSDAVVYTSTASENMIENTTKQCSDGDVPESINVTVKSMENSIQFTANIGCHNYQ